MGVSPVQKQGHVVNSSVDPSKVLRPKGVASIPDRLERPKEEPPSLFKMFLFDPIVQAIRWVLKGLFLAIEALRRWAIEEKPLAPPPSKKSLFLEQLQSTPSPEELLLQFERLFSREEKDRLYRMVGENHSEKISWSEVLRKRTDQENMDLGKKLVRQDPFLLQKMIDF